MPRKSIVLVALLAGLALAAGLALKSKSLPRDSILLLEAGGDLPEVQPWSPWARFLEQPSPTLLDKVMTLRQAAADPHVRAVLLRVTDCNFGLAKAQELRDAVTAFKKSGKPVHAYVETEGGGDLEYYLASAADKVYLSEESLLEVNGLAGFHFYLGGVWKKIYLDPQVDQIREYKSAADTIGRTSMSAAQREAEDALLDSLYGQLIAGMAASRNRTPEQVREMVDAFLLLPSLYREAGWVDGLAYQDEVAAGLAPAGQKPSLVREEEYAAFEPGRFGINRGPKVKVVFGVGNIVTGDPGGRPLRGEIMGSDRTVKQLLAAADDDSVKAVIFRIDSGGGSALASDLIWRAAAQVRAKKPLVVSMSDVAASGGYYIACGADGVVAQPGTITGSIGILTAHFGFQKLLEKIGVGATLLTRGKYADYGHYSQSLSPDARAKTQAGITALYDVFTRKVAEGRKISQERVNEIGRGRIWTGEQAREIGLVDRLGGMTAAVELVKEKLGLDAAQDVELDWQLPPVSLWKLLFGKAEEQALAYLFTPDELELLRLIRGAGAWRSGEPLFLMDEHFVVR